MPFASITKVADADFPTRWGHFRILGFEGLTTPGDPSRRSVESAIALTIGDLHNPAIAPLVRIHSQCLTGDVFHSLRCDCHDQLHLALGRIAAEGAGILLYEQQEGRGIGLMAKLRAYELQDQGFDTIEANEQLGYESDYRHFELPAEILKHLGVDRVRLITNNPEKVSALELAGITVTERLSAAIPTEPTFERYLETKREKMGHLVG
jgi:GTP cyclohydrolase II